MDSKKAHLIYWSLCPHRTWDMNFDPKSEDYKDILKARNKISNRYKELRSTLSFLEAEYLACIEWLQTFEE